MAVSSDDQRKDPAAIEQSPEIPGEPCEYLSRAPTLPLCQPLKSSQFMRKPCTRAYFVEKLIVD
jgi:hypothetical protein